MEAELPPSTAEAGRPPLGSWARLYGLVLGALAIEIALLSLLGRAFS